MFLLSKFNWRWGMAAGAAAVFILIAVIVNLALRHGSRNDPLAGLQPAVYQSADAGETLPLRR
mgnify:FL=1